MIYATPWRDQGAVVFRHHDRRKVSLSPRGGGGVVLCKLVDDQ